VSSFIVVPSVTAVQLYPLEDIWHYPNSATGGLVKPGLPINGLILNFRYGCCIIWRYV